MLQHNNIPCTQRVSRECKNKLNKVQQQWKAMIISRTLIVNYELAPTGCHMPHAIYEASRHNMPFRFTDNSWRFAVSATSTAVEDATKESPPTSGSTHTHAHALYKPNNCMFSEIPLLLIRRSHHCYNNVRYNLDHLQTNLTTPTIAIVAATIVATSRRWLPHGVVYATNWW